MSILIADNLYKTFGEQVLFQNISFTVDEGERIGLIGVNGTGKSTLLKTIMGVESLEGGGFQHAKQFKLEYMPQEPDLDDRLTVLEQIYFGDSTLMNTLRNYEKALKKLEAHPESTEHQDLLLKAQQKMDENDAWEANTTAKQILSKLGITDYFQSVQELSGGQKKRVAIAKALIQPADLLLLDEPTNHLDHSSIEWLERYLSQYPGSFILITHDRYFLNRVTNRIYELDNGNLYQYDGNYEQFLEQKAEREQLEEQAEVKRQNTLRRELAWLRRGPKARGTKQKARIQRIDEMKDQKGPKQKQDVEFAVGSKRLGKKVIEAKHVYKSYDDEEIVNDFNYLVVPSERLGIVGPNGSGKTTLLNLLAGRIQADAGEIDIGETVHIGYYTQENEDLNENQRVLEYIRDIAEVVRTMDGQVITAEQMLERFLFPRSSQWNYIHRLSGGERRRLYLLGILMTEPNVLFLDEPTNDLDTQTLSVLEEYLEHFPGVVITVSHDRYFLDRVVDHLLVLENNAIQRFQGTYSEYMQQVEENEKERKEEQKEKKHSVTRTSNKAPARKKLSYLEQQEWERIEEEITTLEEDKEHLTQEISEAKDDIERVQELYKQQTEVENKLEERMERWTELSILMEEMEQNKS